MVLGPSPRVEGLVWMLRHSLQTTLRPCQPARTLKPIKWLSLFLESEAPGTSTPQGVLSLLNPKYLVGGFHKAG